MSKLTNEQKLRIALTLMQAMCIIALVIGTAAAVYLGVIGVLGLSISLKSVVSGVMIGSLFGLATVITVSVCSYIAIFRYMSMARRLKKERAFTEQNGRTLTAISRLCIISAVSLPVGYAATFFSTQLPDVGEMGLLTILQNMAMISTPIVVLAFMYLGVGMVSLALCGLLHRAKALQDENDLTV